LQYQQQLFKVDFSNVHLGMYFVIIVAAMFCASGFGMILGIFGMLTSEIHLFLNSTSLLLIIFTGAKGADEKVSEGLAMWKYAKDKGIPIEHMIIEDKAVNTYENLSNSKKLLEEDYGTIEKQYRCIVVTNNFHLFRSLIWARIVGLECDGAGSKTKLYFSLNALIREYIGVMYIYKKINIIIISLAFLFSILMTIIDFYFVRPFL